MTAIVDTAYFVDSEQAPLIQIADFVAYMIQRKAALDEGAAPTFNGEAGVVNGIFEQLRPPSRTRAPTAAAASNRSRCRAARSLACLPRLTAEPSNIFERWESQAALEAFRSSGPGTDHARRCSRCAIRSTTSPTCSPCSGGRCSASARSSSRTFVRPDPFEREESPGRPP